MIFSPVANLMHHPLLTKLVHFRDVTYLVLQGSLRLVCSTIIRPELYMRTTVLFSYKGRPIFFAHFGSSNVIMVKLNIEKEKQLLLQSHTHTLMFCFGFSFQN